MAFQLSGRRPPQPRPGHYPRPWQRQEDAVLSRRHLLGLERNKLICPLICTTGAGSLSQGVDNMAETSSHGLYRGAAGSQLSPRRCDINGAASSHRLFYSMAASTIDQLMFETSSSIERRITTCSMASLFLPTVLIPAVICA